MRISIECMAHQCAIITILLFALSPRVAAQPGGVPPPVPTLLTVFPCGGRTGTTVGMTISGTGLDEVSALHFSSSAITAERISDRLFQIKIADTAPFGVHDVRAVTPKGISNPRAFVVGERTELSESEPNDDVPQAQRIEINSTINGVISSPSDVDYFVFTGTKGHRVLASCLTSSIDSRLEARLELFDSTGRRLGSNRRYFENDALLDVTLPTDGDYHLRLVQYAHTRGDMQHFYRLTVTTGPWIDAVFPPMIAPGETREVTIIGRNLPGGRDTITKSVTAPQNAQRFTTIAHVPPRSALLDGFEYRFSSDDGTTNPAWIAFAREPVVLEEEPNDPANPQTLKLPCEVAGRIDRADDRDGYQAELKRGESVTLELLGDRLKSPCDFFLQVRRGSSNDIREFDDPPPQALLHPFAFYDRTSDPPTTQFTAPADGTYTITVGARDAAVAAGPRAIYRLRIGGSWPDFRLIAMPSLDNFPQTQAGPRPDALSIPRDGRNYLDIYVSRREGFNAPITLTAEDLPAGVTCPPQIIPPNSRQAALVIEAAADAPHWAGAIRVVGRAEIGGKTVIREVRPASVTWPMNQRNQPAIARLDRQLVMAITEPGPFTLTASEQKLTAHSGDPVQVRVHVNRIDKENTRGITLFLLNQQSNVISLNGGTIPAGESSAEITITPRPSAQPGEYQIVLVGRLDPPPGMAGNRRQNIAPRYPVSPMTLTVKPAKDD